MGSALERHAAGRDLPAVQERARELGGLGRSRWILGSKLSIPAGTTCSCWARAQALRPLPPDLPRFRVALSPSAPEIVPFWGSGGPVSAERIGVGDFRSGWNGLAAWWNSL